MKKIYAKKKKKGHGCLPTGLRLLLWVLSGCLEVSVGVKEKAGIEYHKEGGANVLGNPTWCNGAVNQIEEDTPMLEKSGSFTLTSHN